MIVVWLGITVFLQTLQFVILVFPDHTHLLFLVYKGVLLIRHPFSLIDIITNTKFSNYPNVFKIDMARK